MHVYGYIRVSHKRQVKSGLGMAAQERAVRSHAAYRRLKAPSLYVDRATSASKTPLLKRMAGAKLDAALQPGDHVIVAKLDRLCRSLRDFENTVERWQHRGVYIHLLDLNVDTSTPSGRMVSQLVAAIAQWESARIGERIKEALEERRRQGRATNGYPPIGYSQRRKRWDACDRERRLARRMLALKGHGRTYLRIAETLNAEGSRNRRGRPWSEDSVLRWVASARAKFPRRGLHNRRRGL